MNPVLRITWIALVAAGLLYPQETLTLRQAVERALASHPVLLEARERVAVAEAQSTQAALRPNPRFTVQTENLRPYGDPGFRFGNDADTFGYLSQVWETGGKRQRRIEAARAERRRNELELELLRRQITLRVKQAYWSAAGLDRIHRRLVENNRTFQQVVEYHATRVREGAMAELDLLRVRLEAERMEMSANAAALDAERARVELYRQMGATDFPNVLFEADDHSLPPPRPSAERNEAPGKRLEMQIAKQAIESARSQLALQRTLAKPDVDFSLGYKRTSGWNTALVGAEIPLPLANRNQGNVAAAQSMIRLQEAAAAAAEALIRAEVRAAEREVTLRGEQLTGTLPRLLRQAEEARSIASAAYREGGSDLLRLLDAERVRIETQVLYDRAWMEYRQALTSFEYALGVDP